MNLHKSIGKLRYSRHNWVVLDIDQSIADFYFSMIPKYLTKKKQKYPAHVTVVRAEYETVLHREHWDKHKDEEIEFFYDSNIKEGEFYYWLDVFSVRLEEIRSELGVSIVAEYTQPPEGFSYCFHTTIANKKEDPS